MTWLVVLGNGSWTYDGVTYRAGKHEVTEDVAARARVMQKKRYPFILSEVEPQIMRAAAADNDGKPLSAAEVRFPRQRGVAVVVETAPTPNVEPPLPSHSIADEFPCDLCPDSFPTADSLYTHIEFEHESPPDVAEEPEHDTALTSQNATSDGVLGLGKAAVFAEPGEPEPVPDKAASFLKPEGEPIPWPEDEILGPHIPMPVTGAEETIIHDVPLQGAPPISRDAG